MSALTVTVSAEDGAEVAQKTVRFQCGLFRETETFTGDDLAVLCRDTILDFACFMLAERFPDHPYGDLLEKVILFRHDSSSDSLALLQESDPIDDGMIIEIVLAATCKQEYDDTICPHILTVHTYRSAPMFCDYCGTILFGLMKQGLNCEGCDKNYHKKCAYKIPNNCTRLKDAAAEGICNMAQPRPKEVWSGRPLWIDKTLKGRRQVPHTLFVHSVKKPTQCHYCKKLLKGVFRQGLKCKDCNICVHKRCAKELGNNCAGEVPSLSRVDSGEWTMANIARHVIANEYSLAEEGGESHDGSSSQDDGRPPTHQQQAGGGGGGEEGAPPPDDSSPTSSSSSSSTSHECYHSTQPMSEPFIGAPMSAIAEEPSGEDTTSNEGSEHSPASRHDSTDNIRLQRVTGVSMRHTKPPPVSVMKEGWMVHYTNKSSQRKKHYWRLDTKCLTLYKTDSTSHYYKEVQLADILAVDPMVNPEMYPLTPPHVFEIVTSAMTYYVGVDMTGAQPGDLKPQTTVDVGAVNLLGDVSQLSLPQLEEKGVGMDAGIAWEEALHSALMPITPQASMGSLADIGVGGMVVRPASFRTKRGSLRGSLRGSFHGNRGSSFRGGSVRGRKGSTRGSFRVPKQGPGSQPPRSGATTGGGGGGGGGGVGAGSSAAVIKHPKVETKMDISLFYQIFPEEILGSGQFGTVFGGQNRQTGKTVAVKVIDKMRFPHKHESQLRTEVTILQTLEHPGIIFLEQMFESPEKIYVVMEKMNGDMLEMILSNENSRLTERTTKFMIYQILMALQYLHKKDIVHCDLKPENVLLTSECGMPMAKLCDFGFARIIGEKSFRKSIVGTPAYLAPEVLKNEGYNRSLDLWSVGVIVYVSLSGTFPFNEDEDIGDQITNAAFMYPPDPWTSISKEAVDLINRLLQVSRKSRFKATQALNHIWLRDVNLWEDLCQLEGTLGTRYMTHESEDTFWLKHGAKPHPLAKVEAQRRAQQQNAMNYTTTTASKASSSSSTSPSSSPPTTTKPSKGYENVTILTGHPLTNNSSTAAGSISSTDTTASSGPGASTAVTFNDVPYLNGSSRSGKDEQDRVTERQKEVTSDSEIKQANRNSDYLNMSDDEILAAQQHAERVGYKVSSV